MNETSWKTVPGKLEAEGFSVSFDRISYDPARPLWCARASREGRQWSTVGENLGAAIIELAKQTQHASGDWPELIAHEFQP